MGGLCTSCRPQVPKDQHASIKHHGSFLRRKTSISAAFTYGAPTADDVFDAVPITLDINTATEEDLMTLPTIGRAIAHNIVEHRKQIGYFLTIEDLVLVNGVGANKLDKFRNEIHVSCNAGLLKKSSVSNFSSLVNINSATVNKLMSLPGITETLAMEIIQYRNEHGRFLHINDLVEPAGLINTALLLKLKSYLTVDKVSGKHSRNASAASLKYRSSNNLIGIGPESLRSYRPQTDAVINIKFGRPVLRMGTWNLQKCCIDKVTNPGVRETVCATILENGLKIIAVQHLLDEFGILKIVDELNNPTLPNIQRLKSKSTSWKCVSSNSDKRINSSAIHSGFVFDTNANVQLESCKCLDVFEKDTIIQPILAHFKVEDIDLYIVCIHNIEDEVSSIADDEKSLITSVELMELVCKCIPADRNVFILGSFNASPSSTEFDALRKNDFIAVLPDTVATDISTNNLKGSHCSDNIWLSQPAAKLYTANYQVVRSGLTNPWIPDGWSWGGMASNHCPIWIELFVDDVDS